MTLSSDEKNILKKTFEHILLAKTGLDPNETSISDLYLSYFKKGLDYKIGEININIEIKLSDMEPNLDEIFKFLRDVEEKLDLFFFEISINELGKIVSQKNLPKVDFREYFIGGLVYDLNFSSRDSELHCTFTYLLESIPG